MNNQEAAELTISTIRVMEAYLEIKDVKTATDELDSTAYVLLSHGYFRTAWSLVKEFKFLYARYCN